MDTTKVGDVYVRVTDRASAPMIVWPELSGKKTAHNDLKHRRYGAAMVDTKRSSGLIGTLLCHLSPAIHLESRLVHA